MQFHNRGDEQRRLRQLAQQGRPGFAVVYGRRRCGKSTLLRRVMNPEDVYFLAAPGSGGIQRRMLAQEFESKAPGFSKVEYPDWAVFFDVLVDRLQGAFTLFLDEFPYLVAEDSSLPGLLQRLIDLGRLPFNLVLCGSSQQMMSGLVVSTAPLYGRAEEIMKIVPLNPGWLSDHFPEQGAIENILEYATWGGVPRYWELRARFPDWETAVKDMLLSPTGVLVDEPSRLLLDDVTDAAHPMALLQAIANGAHRSSEIGARMGRAPGDLSRLLLRLRELGYIRKDTPFGAHPRKSRTTLYKVADPFLHFYFRFIATNRSAIEREEGDVIFENLTQRMSLYIGSVWEELSLRAIRKGVLGGKTYSIKRWWGTNLLHEQMEMDGVAKSEDGKQLVVVECKWSVVDNEASLRKRLEDKARLLPFYRGEEIISVIAGKSFTKQPTGLTIVPEEIMSVLKY